VVQQEKAAPSVAVPAAGDVSLYAHFVLFLEQQLLLLLSVFV